jgi:hypothetical protein
MRVTGTGHADPQRSAINSASAMSWRPEPTDLKSSRSSRPIHHIAYVVDDIAAAARMWAESFGAGSS